MKLLSNSATIQVISLPSKEEELYMPLVLDQICIPCTISMLAMAIFAPKFHKEYGLFSQDMRSTVIIGIVACCCVIIHTAICLPGTIQRGNAFEIGLSATALVILTPMALWTLIGLLRTRTAKN